MKREEIIKATPFLATEHLLLKPLTRDDSRAMFDILAPQDVHGKISVFKSPMTLEQATEWCDDFSNKTTLKGKGYLAGIYNRNSPDILIGYAGISDPSEYGKGTDPDIWEIGYWLDKDNQGKGYVTEAANALIDFAAQTLRLKGVFATTAADNIASASVLLKNGFSFVKTDLMKTASGTDRPTHYYERHF